MSQNLQNICPIKKNQLDNLVDFEKYCKTHIYLQKIGADTDENEQHFAEIVPKTGNYPTGPPGLGPRSASFAAASGSSEDLGSG